MAAPDTSDESTSRILRFLGGEVPAAALRAAGKRVLTESVGQGRLMVLLLAVVTFLGVGATLLVPDALGSAIDAASNGGELTSALLWLAVVFAAVTVTTALEDLIGSYWGSQVTAWLRHRLLGRTLALGVPGQRQFPAGDLLSRLTENAASPASFFPLLITVIASLLNTVGAIVALMLIDFRLGLIFLIGVIPAVALIRRFVTHASQPFFRYQQLLAAVIARLLDAHRGIRTIRASGTIDRDIDRILLPLPELHDTGCQVWAVQRQANWQLSLLAPMLQVLVLSTGGFLLAAEGITPGQLVAAASYVTLALGSIGLFDSFVGLVNCQVGAGRVGEVLDTESATPAPSRPVGMPLGAGRIELRGVTVRREQRTVLDDLTLSVPAGTSVALVGGSGTGKTVLTSLIGRLLDPDEGEVLLDGVPVSDLIPTALRRTVTYAFERPTLLGHTVHDMIAYARPEASRAEVVAAAEVAQADRFIRSLPEGYDTPLAQAPMSGGELQRLGLARAVVADARVLVFDDATSSLDTATEVRVTEALAQVLAGRTSVVVAHRATTASRADFVAWLDAGRIRAFAPHHELWSDPRYRAVFGTEETTGRGEDPTAVPSVVVQL